MTDSTTRPQPALADASGAQIDHIQAQAVSLDRSAARTVEAAQFMAHTSAVAAAQADHIEAHLSALGAVNAAVGADLKYSAVNLLLAERASLATSAVSVLHARVAEVQGPNWVGLLIANTISGEVRPLLDWRGALALVFTLVLGLRLWGLTSGRNHKRNTRQRR